MKRTFFLLLLPLLLLVNSVKAQLSGTYTIPGSYSTVASAINDLNTQGISASVTILVSAGYTETVTAGGFSLYATGTSTSSITFQKSGIGANPLLIAYSTGTAIPLSVEQDGIWRLIGCDYVTIDGIDLFDPNTANPATMEFGYGLFKSNVTNGCRYNTIKNCVITLNRINCQNGTGVASEGSRGIEMVNATSSAHTSSLTITTALGANSYNSFQSNRISNCNVGISMIGYVQASPFSFTDQYNDVGGLTAASGNTIVNYGGGTDNTNPNASGIKTLAQYYVNISNNIINNNDGAGINHIFRLFGILNQAATSANASINNNTITVKSSTSSFTLTGIENSAGSTPASNSVVISGNVLLNCSYSATSTTNSTFFGIRNNGASAATLNISGNTFTNNICNSIAGDYYCIFNSGNAQNVNIINNLAGGLSMTTPSNFGTLFFIANTGASSSGTVSINGNTVQAIDMGPGSGKSFMNIRNFASPGILGRNNIVGNVLNNLSLSTNNTVYFIDNSTNTGYNFVSANTILGTCSKTVSGGNVYGYYNNGIAASGAGTIIANNFSNFSLTGNTNYYGIYQTTTVTHTMSVLNNTISNITAGTGSVSGMFLSSIVNSNFQNNSISNYSLAGPAKGIELSGPSGSLTVSDNSISSFSCTGASTVYGYYQNGGNYSEVYRNKIFDLAGGSAASEVNGLCMKGATLSLVYNNLVGDLRAPLANSWNAINGISITGGITHNVHYNTVRINASSTGFDFGSTALYAENTVTVNLRNNLLINTSTANGSAFTVAYRRSTIGLGSYGSVSNNNLFYAGTPSAANLIFSDATNFMQTLSAYKTFVSPRDAASVTENTSFLSTSGSSANFLHVNPALVSLAESGAVSISSVTTDYDNTVRFGNIGYVGGGMAPDIGADEFETIYPNCTLATQGTITPVSYSFCAGQTASFTRVATPAIPGIQQQWQIASSPGGPYTLIPAANGSSFVTPTLTPGTYYYTLLKTCTITNATAVSNEATVTVYPYPTPAVSPFSSTTCVGAIPVTLSATGGSSYTWSPFSGLSSTSGATVSALPFNTTTYVVTASNLGGCTGTTNVIVNIIPTGGNITASASPTLFCQGGSANLQASASSSIYAVSSISFAPIPTPTTGVYTLCNNGSAITGLSSGNLDDGNWYIVTIPFNFKFFNFIHTGCAITTNGFMTFGSIVPNTYTGYNQTLPNFSSGRPCVGAVYSDLSFVSGGTINFFTSGVIPNRKFVVNWINGKFAASGTGTITTQVILYETSNIVEVHTATNTGQYAGVEGIQDDFGSVAYVVNGRNNQTFPVTNDAYRWNPAPTFTWIPNTFITSPGNALTSATNVQNTITYSVLAQYANGCSVVAPITLSVIPSPTMSVSGGTAAICAGSNVSLTAAGANTYTWNPGSTNTTTLSANPVITTTYIVSGTGTLNSCVANAVRVVTVIPNPTLSISGNSVLCIGNTATLNVSGATTYTWSTGSNASSIYPNPLTTSSYTVVGTSSLASCTGTTNITLPVYQNPTLSITGNTSVCSGQMAMLTASGADTYSWSTGAITQVIYPIPVSLSVFTVVGTSSLGGCTGTAVQTLSVDPSPTISISGNTVICAGQSSSLIASGANTFTWNTGATSSLIVVSPASAAIYNVIGTNTLNTCSGSANQAVVVLPAPIVGISGPKGVCPGGSATLTANGGITYLWDDGSSQPVLIATPVAATSYTVVGTSGTGCTASSVITLTIHPLPTASINASPSATICPGESIQLISVGTGADTFTWSTGSNDGSISTTPLSSGDYTLVVVNSITGCSDLTSIYIKVDNCTGIKENSSSEKLKVYPNPFQAKFYIENVSSSKLEFVITDVSGRTIAQGICEPGTQLVDMSVYAKGLYYMKVNESIYKIISY